MKKNNLMILAMMVAWATDSYSMKRPSPETPSTQAQDTSKRPRMAEDEPQEEIVTQELLAEHEQKQELFDEDRYRRHSSYQRLGLSPTLEAQKKITAEDVERQYREKLKFFEENNASEALISHLNHAREYVLQKISERVLREKLYKDSSYYARLGLWKSAQILDVIPKEMIDQAYQKKLAQLKGKEGSPYMIQLLNEAYETLKNPGKKEQYDRGLQREKMIDVATETTTTTSSLSSSLVPVIERKNLAVNTLKGYRNQNYYERLGLNPKQKHLITQQHIADAYRDRQKAITEKMSLNDKTKANFISLLKRAYENLSVPAFRSVYDARLDQLELNKKQKKLDKQALVEQEDMPVLEPAEE